MRTKPIEGYDWTYFIREDGMVTGGRYRRLLRHGYAAGYPRLVLYKDGRPHTKSVHRLLAEAFIPNPEQLPEVNHKDGIKTNLSLENLEWVTRSGNRLHAVRVLGKGNGWGATRRRVDRAKTCKHCGRTFQYKKRQQRFCNNSCAAKGSIELFNQGILPAKEMK